MPKLTGMGKVEDFGRRIIGSSSKSIKEAEKLAKEAKRRFNKRKRSSKKAFNLLLKKGK